MSGSATSSVTVAPAALIASIASWYTPSVSVLYPVSTGPRRAPIFAPLRPFESRNCV